jgi:hypothetical protein
MPEKSPWNILFRTDAKGHIWYYVESSEGIICELSSLGDSKSNANLIATAPKMLQALKAVTFDGLTKKAQQLVTEAIAEAEGTHT